MLPGLDQLIQRWRANPRPAVTLALCQSLAEYGEDKRRDAASHSDEWASYLELTNEIGSVIDKQHAAEIDVLVTAARMHLSAGAILWAQQVAIRAAKLRPDEPAAFRVLGEALLRRGDAKRAIRALERAVEGGLDDARTRVWRDRAKFYADMQEKRGPDAVRDEVRRVLGTKASQMPPPGGAGTSLPPGVLSMPAPPGRLGVEVPPPSAKSRARRPRMHTLLGVAPDSLDLKALKASLTDDEKVEVANIASDVREQVKGRRRVTAQFDSTDSHEADDVGTESAPTAVVSRPGIPVEPAARAPTLTDEESTATGDVTPKRPHTMAELAAATGVVPEESSFAESSSGLEETVERFDDEPSEGDSDPTAVLDEDDMPTQRRDPDQSMLSELAAAARQVEPSSPAPAVTPTPPPSPPPTPITRTTELAPAAARPRVVDPRAEPDEEIPTEVAPMEIHLKHAVQAAQTSSPGPASSPDSNSALLGSDPRFRPEPGAPPPPRVSSPASAVTPSSGPYRPPAAPVFGPPPESLGDTARLSDPDMGLAPRESEPEVGNDVFPRPIQQVPEAEFPAPEPRPSQEPGSVDSAEGASVPRVEVPRSARRAWLLGVAGVGLAAGFAGVFHWRGKRREEADRGAALVLAQRAEAQLALGSPESIEAARALLERAWALDPQSAQAARASVRRGVLAVLDLEAGEGPALELAARARRLDVHGSSLAAAMLASAVAMGNSALTENLVTEHDESPDTKDDPYYQLAAGAALDRLGSSHALARYQRLTELQPSSRSAKVRLARALIMQGSIDEATPILTALGEEDAPAAHVLASLAKHQVGENVAPPISPDELAALTRPLRAIALALAVTPADVDAAKVEAVCADVEAPIAAVVTGERVFREGDAEVAIKAVECALDLAPRYAPAHALAVRVALASGDLTAAKARVDELPDADSVLVRAILAYEDGDVGRVIEIRAGSRSTELPGSTVTLLAVMAARLRGKRPLSSELLEQLTADAPAWTPVVVIDAALDKGDLDRARELLEMEGADEHPILSQRVARLARAAGEPKVARKAVANAYESRSALRERALIAAEHRAWRKEGLAALDERSGPDRPWLEAYLTARGGKRKAARKILHKVELPAADAELELRILAGVALGEVGDKTRGKRVLAPIVKAFPKRRDVVWAAIALRMLPPSAIRRFER